MQNGKSKGQINDDTTVCLFTFILNCLMACKLYYKPNTKEEAQEVELVTLNNEKKESNIEDYVMTIGEKREIVRGNLPNWVIEDYKNKKILKNK